ncbi:MAG TPA: hypothetical protein VNT75_29110 [Symbiobacteriaceae bacterium]|nr:hypothetical protein [Symbiobacteriaceae bacterium]
MRKLFALLMLLLVMGTAALARADSAPMSTVGPHVQPMESTTVRLESERIDIHVRRMPQTIPFYYPVYGLADYRILFHFVPTADETMTLGFPLFIIDEEKMVYGARLENFKVTHGGREIATETQTGKYAGEHTEWAIFPVTFRKGEPLDLVITYSLPAYPRGKSYTAELWIAYVLRTGALWAGTIEKAEAHLTMERPIRPGDVRSAVDGGLGTTPGWKLENGALHWEWRDVEPDFDLSLRVANTFWLDLPDQIQAWVAKGTPDREQLREIMSATICLLEGNPRSGQWEPVRAGLSGEAAERFLPDVMRLVTDHIRKNPQDWTIRELYLRLLYGATWRLTDQGLILQNEARFRTHMAEYRLLRKDGGTYHPVSIFPWAGEYGGVPGVQLSDAAQAEVAAFLLEDEMPPAFPHAEGARAWVARAAGPALSPGRVEALTSAALKRVAPQEPAPAAVPITAPEPVAEPVAPAASAPPPAPERSFPWAPVAGGLALALGGVSFLIWHGAKRP